MSDAELGEELNVLGGRLVAQQYVGEDLREASGWLSVRTGSGLTSSADPELRNCL